jgi:hypothetical protein
MIDLTGHKSAIIQDLDAFYGWLRQEPLCKWVAAKEYALRNGDPWPPEFACSGTPIESKREERVNDEIDTADFDNLFN